MGHSSSWHQKWSQIGVVCSINIQNGSIGTDFIPQETIWKPLSHGLMVSFDRQSGPTFGCDVSVWTEFLSNFRAIRSSWHPISRLRIFAGFDGKTSYQRIIQHILRSLLQTGINWTSIYMDMDKYLDVKQWDVIIHPCYVLLSRCWG